MKIICVVGTRPNFVKIAPLMKEFSKYKDLEVKLVHTGQHYDKNMSDCFFKDLKIPHPDIFLGVSSGNQAEQTANILIKFNKVLEEENPNLVLVVGDVNSTVACALATVKKDIKLAHVEAGLRSFNRKMPEEINRIITDHISNFLFTTEVSANKNLIKEGITRGVYFVGNVMIDCLKLNLDKIDKSTILNKLNLKEKLFILATFHRAENVDEKSNLENIIKIINDISEIKKVIFPCHPRTKNNLKVFNLMDSLNKNISIIEPLGYLDFIKLEKHAYCVLTDSGGIQEETTFLGTPCLTARKETERPITTEIGTNTMVDLNQKNIKQMIKDLEFKKGKKYKIPELWDGKASERIVKIIIEKLR